MRLFMRASRLAIIVFAVAVSMGLGAARLFAAEIPGTVFNVGGWSGAAYSSDSDGSFSHCAMSATYNSGITLLFAISQNSWSMDLYNSAWSLQQGQSYPIVYSVDGGVNQQASAVAINSQQVGIELPLTSAEFNLFRFGSQVTIAAASQTFQFNLTGTSSSLYALGTCASNHTALASSNPFAASNPFNSSGNPNTSSSNGEGDKGELQAEATTLVANILANAGISFNFIPSDKVPTALKGYLAVWVMSNALGVINIVPPSTAADATAESALLISGDGSSCKGKFASGTVPDETASNTGEVRVFTACDGTGAFNNFYQIIPRAKGGLYLIGTGAIGDPAPARQLDLDIRSVVFTSLNN